MNFKKLTKLAGDASSRKFYRDKKKKYIVVLSKKEKKINLLIYAAINKMFSSEKILAPKLISENYKKNYIILEDLGNITGLQIYRKFNINNYIKLFTILKKFRIIKKRKLLTFLNTTHNIKNYTNRELLREAKLFSDWYLPIKIKKKTKKIKIIYLKIIKKLIFNLLLKKKIFVHRDFHISNIMIKKKEIYVIDSQDSVYGNEMYDLASLIDDVRIRVTLKNREKIFNKYISTFKKKNLDNFRNDFEILSVLRNLKIIGIFMRLSIRDNKHKYLKMIPYAWKLISQRTKNNDKFNDLNNFFNNYFSKEIKN